MTNFESRPSSEKKAASHYFRFHTPHIHLSNIFGDDWMALKAEAFARFFGTPLFLVTQTVVVLIWITLNILGYARFDLYPFILLNLAFSLQAAYAAPLILLAQTRQADRDKVNAHADALHREDLALAAEQRQELAYRQGEQMAALLQQNTELTELTRLLAINIENLTKELRGDISRISK